MNSFTFKNKFLDSSESNFLTSEEKELSKLFVDNGYIINDVESNADLEKIREIVVISAAQFAGVSPPKPNDYDSFLNNIHNIISAKDINKLRICVLNSLEKLDWFRPSFFKLARNALSILVGSELAMQRRINISVQLPRDESSLLHIHADTWQGDSPFEVVLWLPLVNCYKTKSMYFLPQNKCPNQSRFLSNSNCINSNELYESVKKDLQWMKVQFGQFIIFNQSLPHGNIVNNENETRWSFNCRFKGVFTPYSDKKLGDFFEPITLKPISKLAISLDFDRED